jgi:hypothetical protein
MYIYMYAHKYIYPYYFRLFVLFQILFPPQSKLRVFIHLKAYMKFGSIVKIYANGSDVNTLISSAGIYMYVHKYIFTYTCTYTIYHYIKY